MKRPELEPASEMPASIDPVLILSGSDYDMGYQYGQQAAQHFGMRLDAIWVSTLEQFSYDEVLNGLNEAQKNIKKYAPEAIEIFKGIAHGATASGFKMSYFDVLLLNTKPRRPVPEKEGVSPGGCSSFSAWGSATKDGSFIAADSADSAFTPNVTIVAFPDTGNAYIAKSFVVGELIDHPGINNKGLAYVHHGGGRHNLPPFYCLPYGIANIHTLRFASNANEAKDMLLSYTIREGGQWVDIHGNNCVIERNDDTKIVRQAGDYGERDFLYSTNNAICREMGREKEEGDKYVEHGGWYGPGFTSSSIPRNLELWNMLHNYHGEVDLDFVRMVLRFAGDPPANPVPMGAEAYARDYAAVWGTMMCRRSNEYVTIMQPDDGDKGKMYVCSGSPGRVVHRVDPAMGAYPIAPTHTFYEVTLASSPEAVIAAAKTAANDYIAEAYDKLMWLNYRDTGYAGLKELFSKANTEYYQGYMAYNKGLLTGGNEALLYFSEAVTAFAMSQCHAREVLHALVPPPTCPTDLEGLKDKPWFGDWGEWATR